MKKKELKLAMMGLGLAAVLASYPLARVSAAGLDDPNVQTKPERTPAPLPDKTQNQPDSTGGQYPADNTGRNVRDAKGNTVTPEDQAKGNEHDRDLIQKVRKSIVDDSSLSMNAKNVKIVSVNGKLTLRGPVNSSAEKELVSRKACDVAGTANVDNQLEIVAK